jgi:hypothetical protein
VLGGKVGRLFGVIRREAILDIVAGDIFVVERGGRLVAGRDGRVRGGKEDKFEGRGGGSLSGDKLI